MEFSRQNAGVGSHYFRIFLRDELGLLNCRQDFYCLSHQENPYMVKRQGKFIFSSVLGRLPDFNYFSPVSFKESISISMLQLRRRTKKNHSSILPFTSFFEYNFRMTVNSKIYFKSQLLFFLFNSHKLYVEFIFHDVICIDVKN